MSDNYYNNNSNNHHQSYSQGGGAQQYPPPPNDGRYGGSYNQNGYSQPQSEYNTYRPPTDEGYRSSPVPPNMQVTTYDDDRSYNRRSGDYNGRSRHGESAFYDEDRYSDRGHLPPPSPSSRRPSSRGSHKDKDEKRKSEVQSIGATILGGVAGALIGRKAGKKDILPTVLGGVAGAWGGHKLEEEFVERRDERRSKSHDRRSEGELVYGGRGRSRRNSSADGSDSDKKSFKEKVKTRLRSLSRKRGSDDERSRSRKRDSSRRRGNSRRRDDSEDSYDDRRRQYDRRYDSESRQDRDSRVDRY